MINLLLKILIEILFNYFKLIIIQIQFLLFVKIIILIGIFYNLLNSVHDFNLEVYDDIELNNKDGKILKCEIFENDNNSNLIIYIQNKDKMIEILYYKFIMVDKEIVLRFSNNFIIPNSKNCIFLKIYYSITIIYSFLFRKIIIKYII